MYIYLFICVFMDLNANINQKSPIYWFQKGERTKNDCLTEGATKSIQVLPLLDLK